MTETNCDVIVIGAGPAGAVHAGRLAAAGQRVLLVAPDTAHPPGTFELLSGLVEADIREFGLLGAIQHRAPRCAGTVFRWMDRRFLERSGKGWHGGWIIDRFWFDPLVSEYAVRHGARRLNAVVAGVRPSQDGLQVRCRTAGRTGQFLTVHAGRAVVATGRTGRLAARADLRRRVVRSMVAITTSAPGPFPRIGPRLLVDAAPNGWWYAMGDGAQATIGYVTDVDLLDGGPDRLAVTWRNAARGVAWLPSWARTSPVRGRPSGVQITEVPAMGTVLPLGDAAFSADPLSGHGIALAITAACRAADNPDAYPRWVAKQFAEHMAYESKLYGVAQLHGASEFWCRRTRPGSADITGAPASGCQRQPSL